MRLGYGVWLVSTRLAVGRGPGRSSPPQSCCRSNGKTCSRPWQASLIQNSCRKESERSTPNGYAQSPWPIGLGAAGAFEVDRFGLLPATRMAMRRALIGLGADPRYLLLDHLILPAVPLDQTALPRGDVHVLSIAAASIIAKVTRDAWMREIAAAYPEYGFDRHKGYGTWMHRQALERHGPTPFHRYSYQPVGQLSLRLRATAAT